MLKFIYRPNVRFAIVPMLWGVNRACTSSHVIAWRNASMQLALPFVPLKRSTATVIWDQDGIE